MAVSTGVLVISDWIYLSEMVFCDVFLVVVGICLGR